MPRLTQLSLLGPMVLRGDVRARAQVSVRRMNVRSIRAQESTLDAGICNGVDLWEERPVDHNLLCRWEKAGSKSYIKDGGAIKGAYVSPGGTSTPEGGQGRLEKL